jgi:hypothetical protein
MRFHRDEDLMKKVDQSAKSKRLEEYWDEMEYDEVSWDEDLMKSGSK